MKTTEEIMRTLAVPVDKLANGAEPIDFVQRKSGGWLVIARRNEKFQPFVVWNIDITPAKTAAGITYHHCSLGSYCESLAEAVVCAYHRAGKLAELEEMVERERRSA